MITRCRASVTGTLMRTLFALLMMTLASLASAETLKIGVSVADLGNPFFSTLADAVGTSARAAHPGEVDLLVRSSAYDLDRQIGQIHDFMAERVDIIVLAAADSDAIGPAVRQAQQAGIIVAAVDINARGADVTVTTDNVQAGEVACQYMADRLEYSGRVAIINGARVSSVTDRVAGCRSVLNNHPDIELVSEEYNGGGTYNGGLEVMTYLINVQPQLDAVFVINDPSAIGAVDAARMAGQTDVFIVSVDGSPEGIAALQQDPPILAATAAQFPRSMAETAINESLRRLSSTGVQGGEQVIRIPTRLVTRENAEQFKGWDSDLASPAL